MRKISRAGLSFALLFGCGGDTPVTVFTPMDGAWTGTTAAYSKVVLRMTERVDSRILFGTWTGARSRCTAACIDSGIVIDGFRTGTSLAFVLTAMNATRSLSVAGTMGADSTITGRAMLTDAGIHSAIEALQLRRR